MALPFVNHVDIYLFMVWTLVHMWDFGGRVFSGDPCVLVA